MYVTIYMEERSGTISDKSQEIISTVRKLFSENSPLDIDGRYFMYVLYILITFM
jgi:hypothetical protein